MDFSIFSSFLPEGLLSHFNIVDFKELGNLQNKKDCFYIYLDEKNILPKDFDPSGARLQRVPIYLIKKVVAFVTRQTRTVIL